MNLITKAIIVVLFVLIVLVVYLKVTEQQDFIELAEEYNCTIKTLQVDEIISDRLITVLNLLKKLDRLEVL